MPEKNSKKRNMDLIVANNLREEGAGFRTDTNIITIIDRTGKAESLDKMTKKRSGRSNSGSCKENNWREG